MNESSDINDINAQVQKTIGAPERDAETAQPGRALFLQQAASMKLPVSVPPKRRHIEWLNNIFPKERVTMFATILVIISFLLGGTGATVYASQASMPDQPLYAVKVWSEQVQANFSADPEARYELMLRFAEQRVNELENMTRAGKTPPEGIVERLRLHLDECLHLVAQKDDPEMLQMLERLRTRLQAHDHQLAQVQEQAGPPASAILTRARTMLQIRLRLADTAQRDPQQYRNQVSAGIPDSIGEPQQNRETYQEEFQHREGPNTGQAPEPGNGYGPGTGDGYGPENDRNAWGDEIPAPRYRYGAKSEDIGNPWAVNTPAPYSGNGPGPGTGGNPWTELTPTPGSGYGPGPGTGGDQTGCTSPDGCPKSGEGGTGGSGNKK
jgi:hypothetical protein